MPHAGASCGTEHMRSHPPTEGADAAPLRNRLRDKVQLLSEIIVEWRRSLGCVGGGIFLVRGSSP